VLANILTGLGIDEFLTRTDVAGGTTSHFLPDALGSALALTDSDGALQSEYTYEPFSRTTATGVSSTNPYQYTGRENDGTGLYYYRARYYHPGLQRFVSEDPLISQQRRGSNLYAYVLNNPILYSDPLGLDKDCKPRDCLSDCLRDLAENTVKELRDCLGKAGIGGVTLGVITCGVIVALHPYLLPAFPACAGMTAGSTVALGVTACLGTGHIKLGAGIAGCLAGCSGG
jgi:RHS repeat-associated protein